MTTTTEVEPTIVYAKPGELKPCPFCGSESAFEHDTTGSLAKWRVYCCDRAQGCPMGLTNTIDYSRRVEAAEAWNRRSTPPLPDHIVRGKR